jgi:transcriptional regulator with GAF, ATPase, and Fis domain
MEQVRSLSTGSSARPAATLLTFPNPGSGAADREHGISDSDSFSSVLLRHLDRLALSNANVLISGETGTGKEVIARKIHERSGRRGRFIAINCGAFSENLVEAELFGHEAGAFTGAKHERMGWFEAANGGTILLDEIGDLPPAMQVKLLRVLQEKEIVRIGSREPTPIDVRVLAATNVDLRMAVESGQFRQDLFYRISVAPIWLAPLRERTDEIMGLVKHFIGLYGPESGHTVVAVAAAAEKALMAYHWPGNVRELENVIRCALVICRGSLLEPSDLHLSGLNGRPLGGRSNVRADPLHDLKVNVRRLFLNDEVAVYETVEQVLVHEAFEFSRRNQVRAAKILGVSRNVIRTQLKRFGLLRGAEAALPEDLSESGLAT